MNGKRAKCVRITVLRLFEQNDSKFPMGYKKRGEQVFNVRRILYQRIKKLVDKERLTRTQIEAMYI